jgi:hypothetical protein
MELSRWYTYSRSMWTVACGAGLVGEAWRNAARSLEGANAIAIADLTGCTATLRPCLSISSRQHFAIHNPQLLPPNRFASYNSSCKLHIRQQLQGTAEHVRRRYSCSSRMWRRLGHGFKAQAATPGDESSPDRPTISTTRRPTEPAW